MPTADQPCVMFRFTGPECSILPPSRPSARDAHAEQQHLSLPAVTQTSRAG